MQPEVSTPRRRGVGRVRAEGTVGETTDYGYATVGGIGQTIGYYLQQPLVFGSLIAAIIGAFIGARVAQIQTAREQRNIFQRGIGFLSYIGPIALMVMRIRGRRMMMRQMMMARGRGFADVTRDWSSSISGNMPSMGFVRMQARRGRGMGQQIGSALSLIPLTVAILRNPFVRNMGFRMLSRRMTRGMGRGFGRGFMGR